MRVIHRSAGGVTRTLADDVDMADTFWRKLVGVMGRSDMAAGEALVFPFDRTRNRAVHTVLVGFPIDVLWIEQETVRSVKTVQPWTLHVTGYCDTIIELPAGAAAEVSRGDRVAIVNG